MAIPSLPDAARWIWRFARQQALSCIFPFALFATLALSRIWRLPGLPRYDLILIVCLLIQTAMLTSRLETRDELKVVCAFHLLGLMMEIVKTHMGSWAYPEFAWFKVAGVPLYSGFMYASVASYMCQAWRRLDIRLTHWPRAAAVAPLGFAIYLNFFSLHWMPDLRWILIALVFLVFWRTRVHYAILESSSRMPLTMSFGLIGFFVWLAENLATFLGAWQYPYQQQAWGMVHTAKISSWFLLVIVSFMAVAQLKHVKGTRMLRQAGPEPAASNPESVAR